MDLCYQRLAEDLDVKFSSACRLQMPVVFKNVKSSNLLTVLFCLELKHRRDFFEVLACH